MRCSVECMQYENIHVLEPERASPITTTPPSHRMLQSPFGDAATQFASLGSNGNGNSIETDLLNVKTGTNTPGSSE